MKKSVHKEAGSQEIQDKKNAKKNTSSCKRILIADDDPGIQDIFELIFTNAGFEIELKRSGDEILESKFVIPDIFLIDKQLSGYDGLDICRWLKKQKRTQHIPVIIVSATPNLSILSREAGADSFLEKPFELRELLQLVTGLINIHDTGKANPKK